MFFESAKVCKKKHVFFFLWREGKIFTNIFVNIGPKGSESFKMLLLLQIAAESFQTFP